MTTIEVILAAHVVTGGGFIEDGDWTWTCACGAHNDDYRWHADHVAIALRDAGFVHRREHEEST